MELTWTKLLASAAAAVTAAVVASFFGVSGTLIGAAVFSVTATVGNAVYAHSLSRTRERLQQAAQRLDRQAAPRADGQPAGRVDDEPTAIWLRRRVPQLLAASALVFAIAIATVTLVEVVAQQPLSAVFGHPAAGRTTVGVLIGGSPQPTATTTPVPTTTRVRTPAPTTTVPAPPTTAPSTTPPTTQPTPTTTPPTTGPPPTTS